MYDRGHGVKKDEAQARQFFTKAASLGVVEAEFALGPTFSSAPFIHPILIIVYSLGLLDFEGTPRNFASALAHFAKSAAKKHPPSLFCLGPLFSLVFVILVFHRLSNLALDQ